MNHIRRLLEAFAAAVAVGAMGGAPPEDRHSPPPPDTP
jgi:hypothetical protein